MSKRNNPDKATRAKTTYAALLESATPDDLDPMNMLEAMEYVLDDMRCDWADTQSNRVWCQRDMVRSGVPRKQRAGRMRARAQWNKAGIDLSPTWHRGHTFVCLNAVESLIPLLGLIEEAGHGTELWADPFHRYCGVGTNYLTRPSTLAPYQRGWQEFTRFLYPLDATVDERAYAVMDVWPGDDVPSALWCPSMQAAYQGKRTMCASGVLAATSDTVFINTDAVAMVIPEGRQIARNSSLKVNLAPDIVPIAQPLRVSRGLIQADKDVSRNPEPGVCVLTSATHSRSMLELTPPAELTSHLGESSASFIINVCEGWFSVEEELALKQFSARDDKVASERLQRLREKKDAEWEEKAAEHDMLSMLSRIALPLHLVTDGFRFPRSGTLQDGWSWRFRGAKLATAPLIYGYATAALDDINALNE